jgi:hydroxymethylglutaryl-CoA lyase
MEDAVKIVECPRDAWQGLPVTIPAEAKVAYLRRLIGAGFRHIDAVSFVSPTVVPQMADSERVLELLGPVRDVEIIGIVVNARGAQRAIATGAVQTLGYPYSISAGFLERNQRQTPEESLNALASICVLADEAGLDVVAYVSVAFGNPYGDEWSIAEVVRACTRLKELGVRQISLADTVGMATPERIAETVSEVIAVHGDVEIGAHLHSRSNDAEGAIRAAYGAGCRRFDAAIGGLGGCPFAQDEMVGNVATETLIEVLQNLGAHLPELQPLDDLGRASAELVRGFGDAS